jgi:hypothetical protein
MPSANFNFTYLLNNQINKEASLNRDLDLIDALLAPVVGEVLKNTHLFNSPPSTPLLNRTYLIGSSPSGVFSGFSGGFGVFTSAGWVLYTSVTSLVFHDSNGHVIKWSGGTWITGSTGSASLPLFGNVVSASSTLLSDYVVGHSIDVTSTITITADPLVTNFGQYQFTVRSGTLTLAVGSGLTLNGSSSFPAPSLVTVFRANNNIFVFSL